MKSQVNPFKIGSHSIIVILLFFIQSCSSYYKVAKPSEVAATPAGIIQANPQRYFILRTGQNAFFMKDVVLDNEKQVLTCTLDNLPPEHKLHLHNGRGGHMHYKKNKPEAAVLTEVHIYVAQDTAAIAGASYALALNRVHQIEVLEKDKRRTTESYVLGALGITTAAALVFFTVLLINFEKDW